MKRYLLFIIIILLIGCDLFTKSVPEPIPNNKPIVSNAILTPGSPLLGETVELNYQFSDADGDDDLSEPKWFRNDELTGVEGKFFNPDSAQEDDKIYSEVTAYDGTDEGNTIKSNTVVYLREKFAPNVKYLSNISAKEDQVEVDSMAKDMTGKITDQDHTLDELVIELMQTNPGLINLQFSDDYSQLLIESYQEGGSGENEITVKVTDPDGLTDQETFKYFISAMTDISGTILDSDTWDVNTSLQGWVLIRNAQNQAVIADTLWTDSQGKYKTQIEPMTILDIEAGYRSLDKQTAQSFITTARGVLASNDVSGADIMTVTYLNNNLTPEEFRILAWETNFRMGGNMDFTGAKAPSKDMTDKILLTGHPAYTGNNVFTESELQDLKRVIADSINTHLKYPFPLIETNYYDGIYQEENVISWEKNALGNTSIRTLDFDNDGLVDNIVISTGGDNNPTHESFITGLLEEGFGSRGEFLPISNASLEGKTIAYEYIGITRCAS